MTWGPGHLLACRLSKRAADGGFVAGVVDPRGDRPVYRQIADLLRSAIATGVLGPGEQVPSEHELAAEHGVARGPLVRRSCCYATRA
jgi:hypothetical protein